MSVQNGQQVQEVIGIRQLCGDGRCEQNAEQTTNLLVARRFGLLFRVSTKTAQRQSGTLAVVVGGLLTVRGLVHFHRGVLLQ